MFLITTQPPHTDKWLLALSQEGPCQSVACHQDNHRRCGYKGQVTCIMAGEAKAAGTQASF